MKFNFLLILLIISEKTLSQDIVLSGFVTDNAERPIEYFHAVLMSPDDSSMLVGGAFTDGSFSLAYKAMERGLLKISSVGFKAYITPVELFKNQELDTIRLEGLSLDEVIIKARLPVFHRSGGKLTLNVRSTILEDAGSSIDVLKRTPGIVIDNNNNISVFARGTPIIFIDDKEVKTIQELDILQSGHIEKLEIDRAPSAGYDAKARAVIRIFTKQEKKKQLTAEIYNRAYSGRRFSNSTGFTLNNVTRPFTNFMSYGYSRARDKHLLNEYEINHQPNYTIYKNSNTVRKPVRDTHNVLLGSQWQLNKSRALSLQYHFSHHTLASDVITNQTLQQSEQTPESRITSQKKSHHSYLHNISLRYDVEPDSLRKSDFFFDFANQKNEGTSQIVEKSISQNTRLTSALENADDYKVFTGGTSYRFPFFNNGNMKAGGKFSHIQNQGSVQLKNLTSGNITYNNMQEITDNISALYLTMEKEYGNTSVHIGVRGEYTLTNISTNHTVVLDTGYISLFPYASASFPASDHLELSFFLSRKIDRPSFSELNPSVTYFDSLSYGQGNPLLKPTYNHNFSMEINMPANISLSAEYNYNKNARILTAGNDMENPDIVRYSPLNIDKAEYVDLCVDYNFSGKLYSCYANTCIEFPFVNVPFLGSVRKLRKPAWYFSFGNDLAIGNIFRFFGNFNFQSKSVELMTEYGSSWNVSAGVNAKLLKNRLLIGIEANDIFNTSDTKWIDKFGNIESGQNPDYDTRYFRFSLRFRMNEFKGILNKEEGNREELNRL